MRGKPRRANVAARSRLHLSAKEPARAFFEQPNGELEKRLIGEGRRGGTRPTVSVGPASIDLGV